MKIAILHEMFVKFGGAEKVVEKFLKIFPDADIFTLIYDEKIMGKFFPKEKISSQVFKLPSQKIYNLTKKQRFCLPFMEKSIEQLDFSSYDIVLCSSSGFAHGAITKPETKFIVYYHSPARYLWDWTNEYKKDIGFNKGIKGYFLNKLFLKLRQWDFIASNRVDINLANSKNTQNRIKKYYKKDSLILYPPIETKRFGKIIKNKEIEYKNYYIIISTLTEFKKIEIAINSFNELKDKNLIIIGDGDYKNKLVELSNNKIKKGGIKGNSLFSENNIIFVGSKYGDELVNLVQNSLGLIFPGEEDFGIVPIEIMAAGKPIFAYKGGGLKESVLEGITGEFFEDKYGIDFIEKFKKFDENNKKGLYLNENCKNQAKKFDEQIFEKKLKNIIFDN